MVFRTPNIKGGWDHWQKQGEGGDSQLALVSRQLHIVQKVPPPEVNGRILVPQCRKDILLGSQPDGGARLEDLVHKVAIHTWVVLPQRGDVGRFGDLCE
jgi:hypothetical protein